MSSAQRNRFVQLVVIKPKSVSCALVFSLVFRLHKTRSVDSCLMLIGSSAYACAAPSCPHFVVLSSTMATLGAFVSESRRQEARQDAAAADDGYCYPIYQPRVQKMPLEASLLQLCCEASRLRCQLAAVDAQIAQLTAVVPSPWLCFSAPLATAPPGLATGSNSIQIAMPNIARRRVANKKLNLETSGEKLVANGVVSGRDGLMKRDSAHDLGR